MAFSTSNVRKAAMGPFKVTCGDWSGNAGDASGTVTVEGGRVYFSEFNQVGPSTPTQVVPSSWSVPTGTTTTTTVTVHNRETVSSGTFIIIHA